MYLLCNIYANATRASDLHSEKTHPTFLGTNVVNVNRCLKFEAKKFVITCNLQRMVATEVHIGEGLS